MPPRPLLVLALGLLALLSPTACSPGAAQEVPATLYVSGMRIGGRSRAVVRLFNTAPAASGLVYVHYTVRATGAGQPLSLPAAGSQGAPLIAGRTLELDLGAIVNAYRKSLGAGPYEGTVQFVAYGETSEFGPDTIHVDAAQSEGAARFQAAVEWR